MSVLANPSGCLEVTLVCPRRLAPPTVRAGSLLRDDRGTIAVLFFGGGSAQAPLSLPLLVYLMDLVTPIPQSFAFLLKNVRR
jgi:hypothetical protein